MGVMVFKGPKGTFMDQLAGMIKKFGDGFMQFANVGFAYIYVPGDENR